MAVLAAACSSHGTTTAGSEPSAASSSSTPAAGQFGTMNAPVCGPSAGASATASGASSASGAQAQGVTDTSIQVGVLGDANNTIVPGVDKELYDASNAFAQWCNAAGGINGRKLEITIRDAGITQARERMTDACAQDFAVVGGGLALDGAAVDTRVQCGLIDFPGFVNDVAARQAPLQVVAVPAYKDRVDVTRFKQIAAAFPSSIDHFGTLLNAALKGSGRGYIAEMTDALQPLGYTYVYTGEFPGPPAVVDNWRPYVEEMKSKGVKILDIYSSPEIVAPIEQAMRDVGYYPDVIILPANNYSPSLLQAGDALKNTYVGVYNHPFEDAANNAAVKQFLDIMHQYAPAYSKAELGVNSFSAWLLFAQSVRDCGAELTRDCVVSKGLANKSWDGGGLTAPFEVDTHNTPSPVFCGAIVDATTQGFALDTKLSSANQGIYNCASANSVPVEP
jgi:ABC-type branched-subunit amino acid transport system substrate-binding protein